MSAKNNSDRGWGPSRHPSAGSRSRKIQNWVLTEQAVLNRQRVRGPTLVPSRGTGDRDGEREHKSTATTKVRKIQSRIEYQSEIQKHPNPFQKNKKWQNLQSRGLVSKSPGRDQAGVESTKNQSGLTLEARSLTSVAAVEGWRCCLKRGETRCNERE